MNINGGGPYQNHGGGHQNNPYSAYVTDFSSFSSDYVAGPRPDNDLSEAPSSISRHGGGGLNQIDPIAARFGVILPQDDHYPAFDLFGDNSARSTAGSLA